MKVHLILGLFIMCNIAHVKTTKSTC